MRNFVYAGVPDPSAAGNTTSAAPSAASGLFQMLFLLLIFFVMMYFLVILPQRKREKQFKKMISQIKRGDTIITSGGIIGKVIDVKKDTLKIKTSNTTELEISKLYISKVIKNKEEE
ncbi:membrane protein [Thermosipho melanesiensis]|uniref:Preprotein translocase, YajC subunit n=2 Tax=Thermosipho melanesiensis TaxID=46541 RepID=A6LP87_THEM4|nr:preprotein translocase subunit YajC [Thermosipho melanesiensis]ABR31738.1 preprotein translocase, YajC subunit [Thermosipho melanesiensis BI429]APT74760.1 membrane protein [Thermosipho melanesiensis]OOC35079.1 membrane protein [Thermosipho melanesiensis]OOC35115.1 membrane protein [Thermosipho melanesiensis]OOC36723.1 membrane protein [Thermosipho melanesiensis]